MKNILMTLVVIMLVAGVVAISGCTSNSNNNTPPVNVTGITVKNSGYGSYTVTGTITPSKDISYLEIALKWYDAQGNVVERTSLAWNTNDAKAGEPIKFDALSVINEDNKPVKFDLMVFDSVWSGGDESEAIYKTTMNID